MAAQMFFLAWLNEISVSAGIVNPQKEDLEELPGQFGLLVDDVKFFIQSLNDFSEFTDEALNDCITLFTNEVNVSHYDTLSLE